MAGGPLFPFIEKADTPDRVFPYPGGSGGDTEGLGVEASLGADGTWKLRFQLPSPIPSGTAKLQLDALADATSGDAKVNPKWAGVAADSSEDPDGITLHAEGTTTITWAAGQDNKLKRTKITLDADTDGINAGEWVVVDLVFETTSWTLAAISTWIVSIIWE